MNIKNRIKRLEIASGAGECKSNFCLCYGRFPKTEIVPLEIEEFNRRFQTGEETETKIPDFCQKCRKPIDKSRIETTFEEFREVARLRMESAVEAYRLHSEDI